ncbi:MAG: ABC transporter permease [Bdellovibrionaceae bacterium]|nr:ABC transporter permease [Pseudobdellovibrionaceae bacterium]
MPTSFIWLYMEPFIMFLVLGYGVGALIEDVEGVSYFKFIAPGFVLATLMHISFNETGLGVYKKIKDRNFFNVLALTPITKSDIIIGEIAWGAIKGILSTLFILIFSFLIGLSGIYSVIFGLIIICLCSFVFSAMGMMVCSFSKDSNFLILFQAFVLLPMYFLSGAFFPIEILPKTLFLVSLIFPLTHAIMAYKSLILGQIESTIFIHFAVLFIYGFLFYNVSMVKMNKILKLNYKT